MAKPLRPNRDLDIFAMVLTLGTYHGVMESILSVTLPLSLLPEDPILLTKSLPLSLALDNVSLATIPTLSLAFLSA